MVGARADYPDLAAPGGAAALAVAARAGPAGGAGHGDGARGGRGGPPRADRVRPAVGQHAARDRDRAAQPARVRLGQDPGLARGRRAQRVPGQRQPVRPRPAARRRAGSLRRSATRLARTIERPAMLAGRLLNPARADEVVVTPQFAALLSQGRRRCRDHAPGQPGAGQRALGRNHQAAWSRHPGPDRRGRTHRLRVLDRGRSSDAWAVCKGHRPCTTRYKRQHHGHERADLQSTR